MPVFPDDYISTEPAHWGMFPCPRPETPERKRFIPGVHYPQLKDIRSRDLPPVSPFYA